MMPIHPEDRHCVYVHPSLQMGDTNILLSLGMKLDTESGLLNHWSRLHSLAQELLIC